MTITIVGSGYVGLVTAATLASKNHRVYCVDIDKKKVTDINDGKTPFYEPGLQEILDKHLGTNLQATTDLENTVLKSDLSFITVGTPYSKKGIDLTYVKTAATQIGQILQKAKKYHSVVVKSTVIPGTTDTIVGTILSNQSNKKIGDDIGLGMSPEFLREGQAVEDCMHPDRIVAGGDLKTIRKLRRIYLDFDTEFIETNNTTAELIKYTSNALFATMISFSNEIAQMASHHPDVDITEVMKAVHLDKRLTPKDSAGKKITPGFLSYLQAGCGFGGSCFPKDIKALNYYAKSEGVPLKLLPAVIAINNKQPSRVVDILNRHLKGLKDKKIAILGLAFKPDTDDIRESPAIKVVKELKQSSSQITVYDPQAESNFKKLFPNINYASDIKSAVTKKQAVVVLTSWRKFRHLPKLISSTNPDVLLVDGRRMFEKKDFKNYAGIGLSQ